MAGFSAPPPMPRIGIALSGGGARAIAFHLGCLRALHRTGLLSRARVLATVSGGSVIGGLYALHDGSFEDFEAKVRSVLKSGLVGMAVRTAIASPEGLRAALCALTLTPLGVLLLPWPAARERLRRFASRTTVLRSAMDRLLFNGAKLSDTVRPGRPRWIAIATELRSGSAFYFSGSEVGSWRFGSVQPDGVSVAQAVAASAAHPLFLPALDEIFEFTSRSGSVTPARVSLADGGIYDNLGLAPLWPDREPTISLAVEEVDTIFACRAGDGLRLNAPNVFFLARMKSTVAAMHDRAQNATMTRLFDLRDAGRLKRFVLAYLGHKDERLTSAPVDLVRRDEVIDYPTDFSPMSESWIEKLSRRGEQLIVAGIRQHHPDLLSGDMSHFV